MRPTSITPILLLLLLLAACGGEPTDMSSVLESNDLEQIRAYRADIKEKEMALAEKLEALDAAITKLDTIEKLPLITVETLSAIPFSHYIELQGNVQTAENVVLYPEFAGTLNKVHVDEGDRVSKGQILAQIDDGGLSRQRGQLALQVELAKTTYERQSRLWEKEIGSEMQYLQAKTSYESQKEALAQVDRQLAKTTVRAPFAGTIDEIMSEQGSVVSPGINPVMRIVGKGDMYVSIDVPEVHITSVKRNTKAKLEIPVLGKEYDSTVRSVGSYINPANRTFKVELPIMDNEGLIRPNLNTKVKLNDYNQEKAIMIPQSVISEDADGLEYVYVARDRIGDKAKAERVYVETGLTQEGMIEIRAGLAPADELVIEGARAIRDGQRVQILKS